MCRRGSVQGMKEVLGPWTDIPAPDIGTDERVMAWIFDEFSKHKGFSPAVTTGKVRTQCSCQDTRLLQMACEMVCSTPVGWRASGRSTAGGSERLTTGNILTSTTRTKLHTHYCSCHQHARTPHSQQQAGSCTATARGQRAKQEGCQLMLSAPDAAVLHAAYMLCADYAASCCALRLSYSLCTSTASAGATQPLAEVCCMLRGSSSTQLCTLRLMVPAL